MLDMNNVELEIFNVNDVVLLTTIYLCLLFSLLIILMGEKKNRAAYFFSFFLVTQALIPIDQLLKFSEVFGDSLVDHYPFLFRFFELGTWLEGPLLIAYTRAIVYRNFRLRFKEGLYFLPFVIFFVYLLITFFFAGEPAQTEFHERYRNLQAPPHYFYTIQFAAIFRMVFCIICFIEISNCRRKIKDWYSNVEDIDIRWLSALVFLFTILNSWLVLIEVANILNRHFGTSVNLHILGLLSIYGRLLLMSMLIFFNLRYSRTLTGFNSIHSVIYDEKEVEIDKNLLVEVNQFMLDKKPFLTKVLTLRQLSEQLNMSQRHLSEVINRGFRKNFFEFVNHYRIEEAKKYLSDAKHLDLNITDVMDMCGFNTKATFNSSFKKNVGTTPTCFRKKQKTN